MKKLKIFLYDSSNSRLPKESTILMCSSLINLTITIPYNTPLGHLIPILIHLRYTARNLKHLCISRSKYSSQASRTSECPPNVADALADALPFLKNLESLSLPPRLVLHPTAWAAIASHRKLHQINCVSSTPASSGLAPTPVPKNTVRFNSLKSATWGIDYSMADSHIRLTNFPNLDYVFLRLDNLPNDEAQLKFGNLLSSLLRQAPLLRSLHIFIPIGNIILTTAHLPLLSRLRNLSHLSIRTECATSLTDEDFMELASNLPNVLTLAISPDPAKLSSPKPAASFRALSHVAFHSRKIQSISLYIDPSKGMGLGGSQASTLPNAFSNTLTSINFGRSPIESDGVTVAATILVKMIPASGVKICSEVEVVHYQGEKSTIGSYRSWGASTRKDWEKVSKSMEEIYSVQSEQRRIRSIAELDLEERVAFLEKQEQNVKFLENEVARKNAEIGEMQKVILQLRASATK